MKIFYIANARMPTEKAHGLTIAKSCEAFARAGVEVVLLVPRRKTPFADDLFTTYGVEKNFTVRFVPVLDLLRFSRSRFAFWVAYVSFYASAFFALLQIGKRDAVIYTREAPFILLSFFAPAFLECHHIFSKRGIYFYLARRAEGIITISQALKDTFVAAGFSEKKIIVAPSGVDIGIFSSTAPQEVVREELKLPVATPIVMYTGNFTTMGEDKGISDILHALQKLSNLLFVAVGGSDKDIIRYSALAHQLRVTSRVQFVGRVSQMQLGLYQRAADILLMPFPDTPHYRSNMSPVKMFEYMASGRPIIASALPTIREVLNEKNAVIVPPEDPAALARAIRILLDQPERAHLLEEQAKKDVQAYSWKKRTERLLSFIHISTETNSGFHFR